MTRTSPALTPIRITSRAAVGRSRLCRSRRCCAVTAAARASLEASNVAISPSPVDFRMWPPLSRTLWRR